jgi:hypothetical protein
MLKDERGQTNLTRQDRHTTLRMKRVKKEEERERERKEKEEEREMKEGMGIGQRLSDEFEE